MGPDSIGVGVVGVDGEKVWTIGCGVTEVSATADSLDESSDKVGTTGSWVDAV